MRPKLYNVLDWYEDVVAGPMTEEEVERYCIEHENEGPFLIEMVIDDDFEN